MRARASSYSARLWRQVRLYQVAKLPDVLNRLGIDTVGQSKLARLALACDTDAGQNKTEPGAFPRQALIT